MPKQTKGTVSLLICFILVCQIVFPLLLSAEKLPPDCAYTVQSFDGIANENIGDVLIAKDGNEPTGFSIDETVLAGKSLKEFGKDYILSQLAIDTSNCEKWADAKAFALRLKLPETGLFKADVYLHENGGEVYKSFEDERKTSVKLVDAFTNKWYDVPVDSTDNTAYLPMGFDGYVIYPTDFFDYHNGYEKHKTDGELDLADIGSVSLALEGTATEEKSVYIDDLTFVNDVDAFLGKMGAKKADNAVLVQSFETDVEVANIASTSTDIGRVESSLGTGSYALRMNLKGNWGQYGVPVLAANKSLLGNIHGMAFKVKTPSNGKVLSISFYEGAGENFASDGERYLPNASKWLTLIKASDFSVTKSDSVPSSFEGWAVIDFADYKYGYGNSGREKQLDPSIISKMQLDPEGNGEYFFDDVTYVADVTKYINGIVKSATVMGQDFEAKKQVSEFATDSYNNAVLSIDGTELKSRSLAVKQSESWQFGVDVALDWENTEGLSDKTAFFFRVKVPKDVSPKLEISLNESGAEIFKPISSDTGNSKVILIDENNKYTEVAIAKENSTGFIPEGFNGYVCFDLNTFFECSSSLSGNGKIDLASVKNIRLELLEKTELSTFYFDEFGAANDAETFISDKKAVSQMDYSVSTVLPNAKQTADVVAETAGNVTASLKVGKDGLDHKNSVCYAANGWFFARTALSFKTFSFDAKYILVRLSMPTADITVNNISIFEGAERYALKSGSKIKLFNSSDYSKSSEVTEIPKNFDGYALFALSDFEYLYGSHSTDKVLDKNEITAFFMDITNNGGNYAIGDICLAKDDKAVNEYLSTVKTESEDVATVYSVSTVLPGATATDGVVAETAGSVSSELLIGDAGFDKRNTVLYKTGGWFYARTALGFKPLSKPAKYLLVRLVMSEEKYTLNNLSLFEGGERYQFTSFSNALFYDASDYTKSYTATAIKPGFNGYVAISLADAAYMYGDHGNKGILDANEISGFFIELQTEGGNYYVGDVCLAEDKDAIAEYLKTVTAYNPNDIEPPEHPISNVNIGQTFDANDAENHCIDLSGSAVLSVGDHHFGDGKSLAMKINEKFTWGYYTGVDLDFKYRSDVKDAQAVVMDVAFPDAQPGLDFSVKFALFEGKKSNINADGEAYYPSSSGYSAEKGNATTVILIDEDNLYQKIELSNSAAVIPANFTGKIIIPLSYFSEKSAGYSYTDNEKLDPELVHRIMLDVEGAAVGAVSYVDNIGFVNDMDALLKSTGAKRYTTPNVSVAQNFDGMNADKAGCDMSGSARFGLTTGFSDGNSLEFYEEGTPTGMMMAGVYLNVKNKEAIKNAKAISFKIKVPQVKGNARLYATFMAFERRVEDSNFGEVFKYPEQGFTGKDGTRPVVTTVNTKTGISKSIELGTNYSFLYPGFEGYVVLPLSYFAEQNTGYKYDGNKKLDNELIKMLMLYIDGVEEKAKFLIDDICFVNDVNKYLSTFKTKKVNKPVSVSLQNFEAFQLGLKVGDLNKLGLTPMITSDIMELVIGNNDIECGKNLTMYPVGNYIDNYIRLDIEDRTDLWNSKGIALRLKAPSAAGSGALRARFMVAEGAGLNGMNMGEHYMYSDTGYSAANGNATTVTLIDAHTLKKEEIVLGESCEFLPGGFDGWVVLPWSYFSRKHPGWNISENNKLDPANLKYFVIEIENAEVFNPYILGDIIAVNDMDEFIKNPGKAVTYKSEVTESAEEGGRVVRRLYKHKSKRKTAETPVTPAEAKEESSKMLYIIISLCAVAVVLGAGLATFLLIRKKRNGVAK